MSESLKFNTSMQFTYGVADRMAEGVARLVAPNGGPLTFKGTNTYHRRHARARRHRSGAR